MSDLDAEDAELLALAGDDSSDEEDTKSVQRRSRSISQDARHDTRKSASPVARGVAQKVRRRRGDARRPTRSASAEEGEA